MPDRTECYVNECRGKHYAHGLCQKHYKRKRTHGDVNFKIRAEPGEPFAWLQDVALRHAGDNCLLWPFGRAAYGYGEFSKGKKTYTAHRWICQQTHGDAPTTEHEAAHSCGNGHNGCVNPKHIRWATGKENQADRLIHGTHGRGENSPHAKLTQAQVLEIKNLIGTASQYFIAKQFGVSRGAILNIYRGTNWGWLA